jgi:hypothetical protein
VTSVLRRLGTATFAAATIGSSLLLPSAQAFASGLAAPTGLSPDQSSQDPSDAANLQKDPVLSWKAVAGASDYEVEMSLSGDFQSTKLVTLPDGGDTSTNSFALPQALQHGDYVWRVRALTSGTTGPWSTDAQLYRGWDDAPVIASGVHAPGSDATASYTDVDNAPWRFSWTAVPDASTYEVEMSADSTFPQPGETTKVTHTVDCLTQATTFTPYSSKIGKDADVDDCSIDFSDIQSTGGTTYWRVRAVDDSASTAPQGASAGTLECAGISSDSDVSGATTATALGTPSTSSQECSRWSTTGTVSTPTVGDGDADVTALGAPDVSLSCTSCGTMPEVAWQPVSHADSYRVTISDDADATNIQRVYETPFLTLTPRDELPDYTAGAGYHVFVQACTSATGALQTAGCGPAASATFTKSSPAVDGLSEQSVAGGELLAWRDELHNFTAALGTPGTGALEAEDYVVQVTDKNDSEFDAPLQVTTVDRSCDASGAFGCYQPPSNTGVGYGELAVTGLASGSYRWRVIPQDVSSNNLMPSASGSFTIDTAAPTVSLTATKAVSVDAPVTIRASQPLDGVQLGAHSPSFQLAPASGGSDVDGTLTKSSATVYSLKPATKLVTGESYSLVVAPGITDAGGKAAAVTGSGLRTSRKADDTSKAWTFSNGWTKHTASSANGGTFRSAAKGQTATIEVVGSKATLLGCKGPSDGAETVKVDGKTVKTASLKQSYTTCDVTLWSGKLGSGEHTVKVTVNKAAGTVDGLSVSG